MAQTAAERLAGLNAKERQISEIFIRARAAQESDNREMEELSSITLERYQTSELEGLRDRFVRDETENTARLDAYEAALNDVYTKLAALKSVI